MREQRLNSNQPPTATQASRSIDKVCTKTQPGSNIFAPELVLSRVATLIGKRVAMTAVASLFHPKNAPQEPVAPRLLHPYRTRRTVGSPKVHLALHENHRNLSLERIGEVG